MNEIADANAVFRLLSSRVPEYATSIPMAGKVQQALATALTNPSNKARGNAVSPRLAD
jgi:hypothetical protein